MSDIEMVRRLITKLRKTEQDAYQISLWQPIQQQSNHIYRIQFGNEQWIAKVFLKPNEFDDAPHREFAAMQLLSPFDIAPQPIHYEKHHGDQKPVVIYELMQGEMWDRSTPTADELQQLANLWLIMNSAPVESLWLSRGMERTGEQVTEQFSARFQDYANWTKANFSAGETTAAYLKKIGEQRLEVIDELFQMEPVLCFSRADPRFANVIRRPDKRLGMIDWEDSGLRDAARDIADIIAHPNQEDLLSWEEWQAFLAPYLKERRKVDAEIERRVHLYNAVFSLYWLSGLITHGMRRWKTDGLEGWTINTMEPNARLRRYLARALAWPEMNFEDNLDEVAELVFFDVQ